MSSNAVTQIQILKSDSEIDKSTVVHQKLNKTKETCNLFNFDPLTTSYGNHGLLKMYINDLQKVYNSTFDSDNDESQSIIENDKSPKNVHENKFKTCKEESLNILLKAEQLNDSFENEFRKTTPLLEQSEIIEILTSFQNKKQNDHKSLLNMHKHFQIDNEIIENKKGKLGVSEFVGMENYEQYLNFTLKKLEGNVSYLDENMNVSIQNALVYGPEGFGKFSYIINVLIEKGLLKFNKSKTCSSKVKIFLIDFKLILSKIQANIFSNANEFLEKSLKSINIYANKKRMGFMVILKNMEYLVENKSLNDFMLRFIGELTCEIGNKSQSYGNYGVQHADYKKMLNLNKSVFVLLSKKPWLLPSNFIDQFQTKIQCSFLLNSESERLINEVFRKFCIPLRDDWLFMENLENFLNEYKIQENFKLEMKDVYLPPSIIVKQIEFALNIVKNEINGEFRKRLDEKMIGYDAFEIFKIEMKNAEKQKINDSQQKTSKYWKNVSSRLFVIKKFKNEVRKLLSMRRNTATDLRKWSLFNEGNYLESSEKINEMVYGLLKLEAWESVALKLKDSIIGNLKDTIRNNAISNELIKKYEHFKQNSEF